MVNPGNVTPTQWYKKAARFGLVAKGVVYCLSGMIALLASMNIGGKSAEDAGTEGIFGFIRDQPFGKWIVLALAFGLSFYAIWRFVQALKDTEHKGNDKKGIAQRVAYLVSGVGYAGIALYSYKVFIGSYSNGDSNQRSVSKLMEMPFGKWLVIIVALIMIGTGCVQIYRAISGKYKKYVRSALRKEAAPWITTAGIAGYTARGIIWLIIGWLFIKAAIHYDAKKAGSSDAAFKWLSESSYGSFLMGTVAFGLICYGVFMFLRAKYQSIHG